MGIDPYVFERSIQVQSHESTTFRGLEQISYLIRSSARESSLTEAPYFGR